MTEEKRRILAMDGAFRKRKRVEKRCALREEETMNQKWMVLAAAFFLAGSLTACGWTGGTNDTTNDNGTNGTMNQETTGSASQGTNGGNNTNGGTNGGGGSANSGNSDTTYDTRTANNGANGTQTAPNNTTDTRRTSAIHRSAYDYLKDGRYRADEDGTVRDGQGTPNDMTQGARNFMQDTADTTKKAGSRIGNAAKDVGEGIGDAVRDLTQ